MKLKFLTLAAAALAFTSCTLNEMPSTEQEEVAVQTLMANLPSSATTRVAYTDNNLTETSGSIDLAWEDGDVLTIKPKGVNKICAKFTYRSNLDAFEQTVNGTEIIPLTVNSDYVATLSGIGVKTQTKNEDPSHLKAFVAMTAAFTYTEGVVLDFNYTQALMRFSFNTESKPKTLSFKSDPNAQSAILTFGDAVTAGDVTAYLAVPAVGEKEREVSLLLTCEDGEYIFSTTVSKAYEAGKCYVANVTFDKKEADVAMQISVDDLVEGYALPSGDITVTGEPTDKQIGFLRTAINGYAGSVNLTMPDITKIPSNFINNNKNLVSFDGASVLTIGSGAFSNGVLETFNLPSVKTIEYNAFNGCANLTTCNLPNVESLGQAFGSCKKITEVYAPKVSFIDKQAFNQCAAIVKMTIATDPSVTDLRFGLSNPIIAGANGQKIDLYTNCPSNGTEVNGLKWTVKDTNDGSRVYTFKSITQQVD